MWGAGHEPSVPSVVNDAINPSDSAVGTSETCENEDELTNYKELMLKNQYELKKKEEELEEYAEKLTRIKSKVKSSHRNVDSTKTDQERSNVDISSDVKTPKARTHLLHKKLAENRRIFEQRNRELNESQRDVEEKVEAIRQQMNESDVSLEKEKKYVELHDKILELQATVIDLQDNVKEKDSVIDARTRAITLLSEDLSRKGKNTCDELEETKVEMRAMQENFLAVELSLKTKITHLLNQLETKEAELEQLNQDRHSIEQLNEKQSSQLKEIQEVSDLKTLNTEVESKEIAKLIEENKNLRIELEKSMKIIDELQENSTKTSNDNVQIVKLKKDLDETNKAMIKLKAQHKSKLKTLQKRLQNTQTISDPNEELVTLGNQVAILEEEKGNLQLSLVDFDELKATNEELRRQLHEWEARVAKERTENQLQIAAIAQLENQKLDLIQELHSIKQEMSSLEDENAESENERVTAELKIIQLEEQLESLHKSYSGISPEVDVTGNAQAISESTEWDARIESLQRQLIEYEQEKVELLKRLEELDKKSSTSDSTESFERIMETGDAATDTRTILNEKIVNLTEENHELIIKITKIQEKHQLEIDNMQETIENLNSTNTELREKLNNTIDPQALASLESEIADFKQLNENNREQFRITEETLKQQIVNLESKLVEDESIIVDLRTKIETYDITINENLRLIENLEKQNSQSSQEIEELKMENINMIKQLKEVTEQSPNTENLNLADELKLTKSEITLLDQTIETIKAENRRLLEELDAKNRDISELQQIIRDATNKPIEEHDTLEKLMKGLIDELHGKDQTTQEQSATILQLRSDFDTREIQIKQIEAALKEEIEAHKLALNASETKIVEIIREMEDKINQQTVENTLLHDNNENLIEQIKQLKLNLQENENSFESKLRSTSAELMKQIDDYGSLLDAERAAMATILNEHQDVQCKLQEEIEKHRDTQTKLLDMERQILESQSMIMAEKTTITETLKEQEDLKYKLQEEINKHRETQLILAELEEKLVETRSAVVVEKDANAVILRSKEDLENQISTILNEKNQLELQLHAMMNDNKNDRLTIEELEMKIVELNSNINIQGEATAAILKDKDNLQTILQEEIMKNEKNQAIIEELHSKMANESVYYEDLKQALNNAYQELEQLKLKHTEDVAILNERLESIHVDLSLKIEECENLRILVANKDAIIDQNCTKEAQTLLEQRISTLESELEAANSNTNAQMQKMKIIAANLKKKTNQCRHIEDQFRETKENWRTERREKDELTEKLEIMSSEVLARNEMIAQLEERIQVINNDTEQTVTSLQANLADTEMNLKNYAGEYESLKLARDAVETEFMQFKETSLQEITEKNFELLEMKEKARELGVRMQVMETEYLEQLNMIQQLKTENAMLLSKQTQLNERLENTEMEFTEYRNNLEIFQNKIENTARISNQTINDLMLIRLELGDEMKKTQEKVTELEEDVVKLAQNFKKPNQVEQEEIILGSEVDSSEVTIKLDDDEAVWGWNAQEAEMASGYGLAPFCSTQTMQMQTKMAELEDAIKDMEAEKMQLTDQLSQVQMKNGKLMKKLRIFKIQIDGLQQQLKLQMTSGGLCDLDSAIEEELRNKVIELEKQMMELKSDNDKVAAERDNYLNRIDALIAANERFTKVKERQDHDLEVMSIRNEELLKKIETLENKDFEFTSVDEECLKCKNKIADVQENLELLAAENEELQQLIELKQTEMVQKNKEIDEYKTQVEEMKVSSHNMLERSQNREEVCHKDLDESNQNTVVLERNYEQLLSDANLKITGYQAELEEKVSAMQILENDLAVCRVNFVDKTDELLQIREELKNLQDNFEITLANKQSEVQTLTENVSDSNKQLYEKTELLAQARGEFEEIQNRLEEKLFDKQSQIEILEENLNNCRQNLNEKIEELEKMQQEFNDVKFRLESNENILNQCLSSEKSCQVNLEVQKQQANTEHDLLVSQSAERSLEFNEKLLEKDNNLKILETELLNASKDQEKWRQSYNEAESKITEITENMATVTELLNVRVQEVADLKLYIQKLEFDKRDLENCQTTVNDLKDQLISKKSELTSLTSIYDFELNSKLSEIDSLKKEITEMNQQHIEAIKQQEVNNRDLENCQATTNDLRDQLMTKKSELMSVTSMYDFELNSKLSEIDSLKKEITEINQQHIEAIKQQENKQQDIIALKEALINSEELITATKSELSLKDNEIQRLLESINELERLIESLREDSNKIAAVNLEEEQMLRKETVKLNEEHETITEELKRQVSVKDEEIADLKYILDKSTYPTIIQNLQDKIDTLYDEKSSMASSILPNVTGLAQHKGQNIVEENESEPNSGAVNSSELDVALYMLHQRDVRCEELTHELMQLLEERDTLQLRLSNAIRLNQELGKLAPTSPSTSRQHEGTDSKDQQTENTSPSVETYEDEETLARKLSQLHNVGHHRDVRLIDERELRNTQQMSFVAHRDALSTLPDAAARLINAKYTLTRDVQSPSSVLINWLWRKSTPKIVHM